MSTIKTTTLSTLDGTATVPVNTVVNGSAKAWVNFNGTGTVAIRASFNVTSITDNGTGDYTVNFTVAMVDANYVVAGTCGGNSLGVSVSAPGNGLTQAAGSVRITTGTPSAAFDPSQVQLSIFR
jgi:hypothetical protein